VVAQPGSGLRAEGPLIGEVGTFPRERCPFLCPLEGPSYPLIFSMVFSSYPALRPLRIDCPRAEGRRVASRRDATEARRQIAGEREASSDSSCD
jgi:hypothetical protein